MLDSWQSQAVEGIHSQDEPVSIMKVKVWGGVPAERDTSYCIFSKFSNSEELETSCVEDWRAIGRSICGVDATRIGNNKNSILFIREIAVFRVGRE